MRPGPSSSGRCHFSEQAAAYLERVARLHVAVLLDLTTDSFLAIDGDVRYERLGKTVGRCYTNRDERLGRSHKIDRLARSRWLPEHIGDQSDRADDRGTDEDEKLRSLISDTRSRGDQCREPRGKIRVEVGRGEQHHRAEEDDKSRLAEDLLERLFHGPLLSRIGKWL